MEKTAVETGAEGANEQETHLRQDLISKAVQFLTDEKVSRTSVEHQKAFLLKKGLSQEEIDGAYRRIEEIRRTNPVVAQTNPALSLPCGCLPQSIINNNESRDHHRTTTSWRDYANLLVLAGSATYITFTFVKNYVIPRWTGAPRRQQQMANVQESLAEVQNGLKFLIDSVQQTLTVVQKQQDASNKLLQQIAAKDDNSRSIERTMYDLKTEITVIKNLLLGRDQFPPVPQNKPLSLPAWQQAKSQNGAQHVNHERVFMNRGDSATNHHENQYSTMYRGRQGDDDDDLLYARDEDDMRLDDDDDLDPPPSADFGQSDETSEKTTPV